MAKPPGPLQQDCVRTIANAALTQCRLMLQNLDCHVTLVASQLIAQDVYNCGTMTHCAWTYMLVYELTDMCAVQIMCHFARNATV